MSVSRLRILGLMVVSACLVVGCSGVKKIDVGGACILNSDCNQPLVCTMGKCHDACHTSADCPTGQSCVKSDNSTICQLPAEGDCSKTQSCSDGFLCTSDQRCRAVCQSPSACTGAQACMSGTCHDACQVSADCQIGQSCVKTGNATICQLPAEADCSTTLSCSGGLVCAPDLRCRTACQSRTDCTTEQMCVGGICAAPSELDVNGQLPQRGPSLGADGGTDVPDAGGQGADVTVGPADAGSLDSGADLPVGAADARGQEASASDLANPATDAPLSTLPDSGSGTGSDTKTADSGGSLTVADAGVADRLPTTPDSSGRGDAASDTAGGGTCAAGPDGWCWWTFVHPSTTATWVTPPSASSVHVSLTAEPASINLGNAGIGFTFAADTPLIDLTRFDRIVFTATASMGFEFNVASSGTAGCDLNFAGSGTEQTYTLNFSECTRWTTDSTQPAFSLAAVWYIHWDTLWGTASSLDIKIVPDILFCLGTQCTANPLSP